MSTRRKTAWSNLTWPAIEKIEASAMHFHTDRRVSKEHLSSMNLSFSRGDDPANVRENYRRFCEAAGFEVENNCYLRSGTHNEGPLCDEGETAAAALTRDRGFHDIDGMDH